MLNGTFVVVTKCTCSNRASRYQ